MARQFDVFEHPVVGMRRRYPYVLVIQHNSVSSTDNVVIAPLIKPLPHIASRLYPLFDLIGDTVMMLTPDLAVINRARLKKTVANFSEQRGAIVAALDLLFVGS